MDAMMNGKEIKSSECKNPVDKQFQMGQMVGVQGTPAIVLANGQLLPRLPAGQAVGQAGAGGQIAPGLPNN